MVHGKKDWEALCSTPAPMSRCAAVNGTNAIDMEAFALIGTPIDTGADDQSRPKAPGAQASHDRADITGAEGIPAPEPGPEDAHTQKEEGAHREAARGTPNRWVFDNEKRESPGPRGDRA